MRALAYLLGARALDIARDAESARPLPDVPLDPIATTDETATAWRRWAANREASPAAAEPRPRFVRASTELNPSPI
jgi:hypothetical protein